MAVKCKMPNCRSYTSSESGLCGYHEQKAIKLRERLDAEQLSPGEEAKDRERFRLMHAQTFEKFTSRREEDENYERISRTVREAVEATLGKEVSREVFDGLRQAQEEVKKARLRRDQRDELWRALQEGFENEKKKREAKQREWEERKRHWQENAASLNRRIETSEQEVRSSTDWRGAREQLKQIQQECRDTDLSRDDRNAFYGRLQAAFETLGSRQTEERERYERSCSDNYRILSREVADACETARAGSDFHQAFEELKNAQNSLRETRPTKREDRDALFQELQRGFAVLKERQDRNRQQRQCEFEERKREHERKKAEWRERQREKIDRLERAMDSVRESIRRDTDHLADLKRKHDNVRPGKNASEIYRTLNAKMEEVANRRWEKQRKLSEMESSLANMKSDLARSFS